MDKQKKLCPFKKQLRRTFSRAKGGNPEMTITERFDTCEGDRCAAYKNGKCLRLSGKEA